MGWWPFSRKRKISESAPSSTPQLPSAQRSISAPTLLQPPIAPGADLDKLTPRQSIIHPAFRTIERPRTPLSQVDNERSLTALPPTPGSLQRPPSANLINTPRETPNNPLARISFDTNREFVAARRGIEHSPHLRPVRESELNRSASTRSRLTIGGGSILRRKSTKKSPQYPKREEQLRAMKSMPMAKRSVEVNRPKTRETKRPRPSGAFSHGRGQGSVESLAAMTTPRVSTMGWGDHSHLSLTPVSLFSPRPTLAYSVDDKQHYAASSSTANRLDVAKGKMPISRRSQSRTIDELADDLDASALRQLMDRDQKRKDRKREEQEARARRRLERYAARDEEAELEAPYGVIAHEPERGRTPSRRVYGSVVTAVPAIHGPEIRGTGYYDPFADPEEVMAAVRSGRQVFPDVPYRDSDYSASPPRDTIRRMTPPTSPSQPQQMRERSTLTIVTNVRSEKTTSSQASQEALRTTASESSNRRGPLSSLFRRSIRQTPTTPSESSFVNTSRDSVAQRPLPAHLGGDSRPLSPIMSGTQPLRSVSRFREDLPEMPISPPDSRLGLPALAETPLISEAETLDSVLRPSLRPITATEQGPMRYSPIEEESPLRFPTTSYDSPVPTSPTAVSESLASVDAEASWLSGRSNRASARSSVGRRSDVGRRRAPTFSTSYESIPYVTEEAELEDPFDDPRESQKVLLEDQEPQMRDMRATLAMDDDDSSDELPEPTPGVEGNELTHGSVARTPTVIQYSSRVKSTEGLLKRLNTGGSSITQFQQMSAQQMTPTRRRRTGTYSSSRDSSPTTPMETPWVEAAHARHLSSGSARLLDIPARGNSLRASTASSPAFELQPSPPLA